MKVLYLTQLYPPMMYGGGEYIFSKWAEEMAGRGHEITVITQQINGISKREMRGGVEVIRVPPAIDYKGSLYGVSLFNSLLFLIQAIRYVYQHLGRFDLIHSNTFVPTFAAEIVGRLKRKPHVATIHDVYLQTNRNFWGKWSEQVDVGALTRYVGKIVERIILKLKPTIVHTVSDTSSKDLVRNGVSMAHISVIPNGLNLCEYKSVVGKKRFQMCYIGRIVFYKNIDTVIKAMKKALLSLEDIQFIIGGTGPYEGRLKMLTEELGLSRHVKFIGRINDEQKVDLLTSSQLMVQPSLVEGFGITVIEAFACGTPVLASDVMPLPELVKDGVNGATIQAFDEESWAKNIIDYLSDPDKCARQGNNGKKLVEEKYNIEKVVDQLEALYCTIK